MAKTMKYSIFNALMNDFNNQQRFMNEADICAAMYTDNFYNMSRRTQTELMRNVKKQMGNVKQLAIEKGTRIIAKRKKSASSPDKMWGIVGWKIIDPSTDKIYLFDETKLRQEMVEGLNNSKENFLEYAKSHKMIEDSKENKEVNLLL
jgi:hypothetical protein